MSHAFTAFLMSSEIPGQNTVSRALSRVFFHEDLSDILLSAMWESQSDELCISVRLLLLALHDNSRNAVLVVEVDTSEVANRGRCNVVADSELDLQWWQFWF